jgi:hypothetical protein
MTVARRWIRACVESVFQFLANELGLGRAGDGMIAAAA